MKKLYIALVILSTIKLTAAPGCIDNSCHLTKLYDYKDYHQVACNCPCQKQYKIMSKKAQCQKCLHYRDPHYTNRLTVAKQPTICFVKQDLKPVDSPIGYTKQIMQKL